MIEGDALEATPQGESATIPPSQEDAVIRGWAWLLAAVALMIVVQLPTLQFGFVGDDFEWWLATRHRMVDPERFLQPFGGLRLTNPPLLAPDQLVWGTWAPGWHITTLALHALVMGLIFGAARRAGIVAPVAAAIAAVWGTSPYTSFLAREIHVRHDPLLLACWLGVGLLWPGPNDRWTSRRVTAAVVLTVVAALTKESWIVLPGFAAAFEVAFRRRHILPALRTAAIWSVAPVLFVAAYLLKPAVGTSYAVGYYSAGLRAAVKIPSTLAAFFGVAELDITSSRFGPLEWLMVVVLMAIIALALRARPPALVIGLAFFLLPFVPLIPVGFMPVHYAYAPYAGFLLMVAGSVEFAIARCRSRRWRVAVAGTAGLLVLVWLVSGFVSVSGEMADARRRDEAHRRLVAEAEAFLPQLPRDRAVVCVRLERVAVNAWLLEQVEGLPKTYFERGRYPYGLVGWAELFSWVCDPRGGPLWQNVPADSVGTDDFVVIGHVEGRFVALPSDDPTAAAAANTWSAQGHSVRVIRPLTSRTADQQFTD